MLLAIPEFDAVAYADEVTGLPGKHSAAAEYASNLVLSAAGAVQELMSVLSLPREHRWHICGAVSEYNGRFAVFCFSGFFELLRLPGLEPAVYEVRGCPERYEYRTWFGLDEAQARRAQLLSGIHASWRQHGGFSGPKFFMPPFLVPMEVGWPWPPT